MFLISSPQEQNMKGTLLILIVLLLSCSNALSQTPVSTPPPLVVDEKGEIEFDSRLVIVPVSVTDGNGEPIKGLAPENFVIRENSRIQEIAEVTPADKVPLEIALLFDVSASTDPMFKFEQETAARFLQEVMRPQDRATIFTIGEIPKLIQTRNVAYKSVETIKSIQPTKQFTAFFETVRAAAAYLGENALPKSRKVVIAITDGEDTKSLLNVLGSRINRLGSKDYKKIQEQTRIENQASTLKRLQDSDAIFYSINPTGSSYKMNKIGRIGQESMVQLARETGGEAFVPRFVSTNLKSEFQNSSNTKRNYLMLSTIFMKLRNELQAQYLVQYYSNNDLKKNQFVKVDLDLKLKLPQGTRLRSRNGYFVK